MPKIKQLRKSQNLNAMELAEKAGLDLNQPLMSAVESGKVLFTPDDLKAVCEALQCTPLDLFDNADEFDLMAIQRRMGASVSVVVNTDHGNPKRITPATMAFFDEIGRELPPPNPKRSFRMSDEDWKKLHYVLAGMGYSSVGHYLKAILSPYSKQA